MHSIYDPVLKAHRTVDRNQRTRYIRHSQAYWQSQHASPREAAIDYLRQIAPVYQIPAAHLANVDQPVGFDQPRDQGHEYRASEEKPLFDGVTYGFWQTYHNVPVWRAGLSVTLKQAPNRVVYSADLSHDDIAADKPHDPSVERYKKLFQLAQARPHVSRVVKRDDDAVDETTPILHDYLTTRAMVGSAELAQLRPKLSRGRFFVYKYQAANRLPPTGAASADVERDGFRVAVPLPAPPAQIRDGESYVVGELIFSLKTSLGRIFWLGLFEIQTNALLFVRPLIDGVNGLVFIYDPLTATGVLTNTANKPDGVLNPLRTSIALPRLDPPAGDKQALSGSFARVSDDDSPTIAPPTISGAAAEFDYDARTNEFAAVNAYFHTDQLFGVIEDLGFPIHTYFDGTTFPVHVDHRASTSDTPNDPGLEINAFCSGDAESDGIGLVGMCLADLTDTQHPLGRATDKWVFWHEVGGHGILWDHVNSPNFGFAHSAGDSLAAFQNDPESKLRGTPDRFRYAPFRAGLDRWLNRGVADGWGWGGVNDVGMNDGTGYNCEQILATTLFRFYNAIGGDSDDVAQRWFASRVATYLVLRAVGTLTPATNPDNAIGLCTALMAVDLLNWTSEGVDGGAYNKVIRWAFEQQGLYQPQGAPTPVTTVGAPPTCDVYIEDGRAGQYAHQAVCWETAAIWNRTASDNQTAHQNPIHGQTNYAYAKIKNRGTAAAAKNIVKGYHSAPGTGLTWPADFAAMEPAAGIPVDSLAPASGQEVTVGPFSWTPTAGGSGLDGLLFIVSADGDVANTDHIATGEAIPAWRLVPNDNNIAQRNLHLLPGANGSAGFAQALQAALFTVANPFRAATALDIQIVLPDVLTTHGWQIKPAGLTADTPVAPADKRAVTLSVTAGTAVSRADLQAAVSRDIRVLAYGQGILIGGVTYRIDPDLQP